MRQDKSEFLKTTWSIYDALEMTTQSPAYHMNYHFMHNDGSTENFDISGEFYVEHSGDEFLSGQVDTTISTMRYMIAQFTLLQNLLIV